MKNSVTDRLGFGLGLGKAVFCASVAGVLSTGTLFAQAVGSDSAVTVPDAQVEANVLRALASAPDLATQNIQSATVYGTVTLSGNVHDEAMRTEAENLVARAQGVKKVVDQMTLGDVPTPAAAVAADQQPDPAQGNVPQSEGQVLRSDGSYAPAPSGAGQVTPGDSPQSADTGAPGQSPAYPQPAPAPAPAPGYGAPPPPSGRQPMYANAYVPPPGVAAGQQAGIGVTIPAGATLRVRINRGLASNQIQPGTAFDGTVMNDIVANGVVAVPRGATVQGTVVDAKKAGVFKGQGELGLQINSLTLGGTVYPVNTQVWQHEGPDKTAGTVNRTVGTSALGAIFGAVAGGGEGAAIGAGVGAGLGLAGSAASPRGQVIIPPESVLTFTTAQPVAVKTVSQAEMARLSYAAGPGQPPPPPVHPMRRYYSPYYGYYYAPAY